jgi:hypothetical protein
MWWILAALMLPFSLNQADQFAAKLHALWRAYKWRR